MLELYVLETCPYCKKVTDFLEKEHMKYTRFDICDEETKQALIKIGGKRQVPFLVDTERNIQMYESDDIIEYEDEYIIIDYKLSNIDDINYVKQLKGYREYLSKIVNKPIKLCLYSLFKGEYKIID